MISLHFPLNLYCLGSPYEWMYEKKSSEGRKNHRRWKKVGKGNALRFSSCCCCFRNTFKFQYFWGFPPVIAENYSEHSEQCAYNVLNSFLGNSFATYTSICQSPDVRVKTTISMARTHLSLTVLTSGPSNIASIEMHEASAP